MGAIYGLPYLIDYGKGDGTSLHDCIPLYETPVKADQTDSLGGLEDIRCHVVRPVVGLCGKT